MLPLRHPLLLLGVAVAAGSEPGPAADAPAMTEDLDSGVGLLLDKIEELGIGDNTEWH